MMYVECIHGIDLYRRHLTLKVYHYVYLSVSRVNFWIPQWLYFRPVLFEYENCVGI